MSFINKRHVFRQQKTCLQSLAAFPSAVHFGACIAVYRSVSQCIAVYYSVLQCSTVCPSVVQCGAVCCSDCSSKDGMWGAGGRWFLIYVPSLINVCIIRALQCAMTHSNVP